MTIYHLVEMIISIHLGKLDALSHRHYRMVRLKALHGLGNLPDEAVILFDAANNVLGWSSADQPAIFNSRRYGVHENVKCQDKERTEAN